MSKNKNRKEEKFERLVAEEEIEVVGNYGVSYSSKEEFSLATELKGLKILTCISICITILSLLLSLIILSKLSNSSYTDSNGGSNTDGGNHEVVDYDTSMFTKISLEDFINLYKKDGTYFVYTGRSTCGYCVAFLPHLQQSISEYDYTLYYLDIDSLSNEDLSEIAELHDKFASTIGATPMVYVMGDKDVVAVNEGYTEYDTYAKFLEDNGIKKRK